MIQQLEEKWDTFPITKYVKMKIQKREYFCCSLLEKVVQSEKNLQKI